MKKLFIINILLAALIAVVACTKEENTVKETPEVDVTTTEPVTISVNIPEKGLTKVAMTQDPSDADGVVKLTWESTDAITVKNAADESKSVEFGYVSGAGSASAVFSAAGVSALAGATSYNIYLTSGMPADFSNQDGSMGYSATLLGVNKYDGVTFSQAWAEDAANGGGSCASSSVLRIRAKMPSASIASAVQAVIIKSDKNLFAGKDSIRIECTPEIDDDIISVYATLPAGPVSEATATKLLFQFQKSADKNDRLTAYREVGTLSLNDGSVNSFKISCTSIDKYAGTSDNGSLSTPYLVGDRNQLQYMNTLMGASEKHFKLIDNIKLRGFSWTPLNSEGTKVINLDGNNKRISNLNNSLFADLNGTVKDLTIYNAVVSSPETVGILANTCNTAASTVTRVTVTGDESPKVSSLTNTAAADGTVYVGGLVGEVSSLSTFDDCHVINTTINGTAYSKYTGGAIGYFHISDYSHYVENCTIESCAIYSDNYVGGLIGYASKGRVLYNKVGYDSSDNEKRCTIVGIGGENSGNYKGGLIGLHRYGYATNNKVLCTVRGSVYIGGLIGQSYVSAVDNTSSGEVVSSSTEKYCYVGGLIGESRGAITNCHSTCSVTGTASTYVYAGGLVGKAVGGTIDKCSATGSVKSDQAFMGGLIGQIAGDVTVKNSYATGDVAVDNTAYTSRGGLVGNIKSGTVIISNCYSTGTVSLYRWSGGFIGTIEVDGVTVSNCYTSSSIVKTSNNYGLFIGNANKYDVTYSGIIAWNTSSSTNFVFNITSSATNLTSAPDGNYFGTSGTINSQATALGWGSIVDDSSNPVWDLTWADNRPHLAWEEKP